MSRLSGRAAMRLRKAWQIHIDAGRVKCWRCGDPIEPGSTEWDLGHTGLPHIEGGDAHDVAPEHRAGCNRRDGALLGNQRRRRPRRRLNEWKEAPNMTRTDTVRAVALAFLLLVAPGLVPDAAAGVVRPSSSTSSLSGSPVNAGHRYCGKLVRLPHSTLYRCSHKAHR